MQNQVTGNSRFPENTGSRSELSIETGDGLRGDAIILDEKDGVVSHTDIGRITATELDGITINRTKSKIDPFIEIRKERLVDRLSGAPSRSFGIWVPEPEADGGWRDMGTVSENYLLLTNREVRELSLEIAERSRVPYNESRIFWDGARFAHVIDFVGAEEEVASGDSVGLSLITRTSYDRSWKYEAALMGKRFLCDNGLLSGEFFARVSFKHMGGSQEESWREVVREGLSVLAHGGENLERFVGGLRKLRSTPLTDEHLRALWIEVKLGDSLMGKVMSRYVEHEESTLYGFLNAGSNVFWHNAKMTGSDFQHNDAFTTKLLAYAFESLN